MSTELRLIMKADGSIGASSFSVGALSAGTIVNGEADLATVCGSFSANNPKYCYSEIDWPAGYWRRLSSPCIRLVIWCNAHHDADTYHMGEPYKVYRIVQDDSEDADSPAQDDVFGIECDCGEGSGVDVMPFLGGVITGSGEEDVECLPTGDEWFDWLEDTNYFMGQLGKKIDGVTDAELLPGQKHMVWAVITAWKAYAEEIKPSDYDAEESGPWDPDVQSLGFANMRLESAGIIMHNCSCGGNFNCNGISG